MLRLTTLDTRSEDIATIIATPGRPDLKNRILAYRERVIAAKSNRNNA